MRDLRGREMSMIFQNPRAALNPIRKVGRQIEDVLRQHAQADSAALTAKAVEILDQVRIARPRERYHAYPFELSGGMCQRVVIALALACKPQLLIADEPTTGLDVTTQKTVMDLVTELTRKSGMSTILITHDLGLAATYCDRVVVMEKGHVVETAESAKIFKAPAHPYTRKLMRATPRPGVSLRELLPEEASAQKPLAGSRLAASRPLAAGRERVVERPAEPLLVVEKLVKEYPRQGLTKSLSKLFRGGPTPEPEVFRAVDGISFTIDRGESVGLVGESGCGKSTTSTMVMRLIDKTDGLIKFGGDDIGAIPAREFATTAAAQAHPDGVPGSDRQPESALHRGARDCGSDPAARRRARPRRRARTLRGACQQVGLPLELLDRFPHQLSGGQKARVGIARAIALQSGTDHPRRADRRARRVGAGSGAQPAAGPQTELGMSYLFVSHDLNVVRLSVRPRHRHAGGKDRRAGPDRARAVRSRGAVHARPARGDPASAGVNQMPKQPDHLDAYIDAAAQALGLTVAPEWKPAVRANLDVTFKLAALVAEKELPDDAEPAPVFKA